LSDEVCKAFVIEVVEGLFFAPSISSINIILFKRPLIGYLLDFFSPVYLFNHSFISIVTTAALQNIPFRSKLFVELAKRSSYVFGFLDVQVFLFKFVTPVPMVQSTVHKRSPI
jgi:hypothetical protein